MVYRDFDRFWGGFNFSRCRLDRKRDLKCHYITSNVLTSNIFAAFVAGIILTVYFMIVLGVIF